MPQGELEDAVLAQMSEVYRDTELVGMAIEAATAQARSAAAEAEQARSALRAEAADVRRKIERYVTAFESGTLAASAFGGRVDALQAQLDPLDARLVEAGQPTSAPEAAIVSCALSEALGGVLRGTPVTTTKALLRVLVEEIRVVSPEDIRPTYRVPM